MLGQFIRAQLFDSWKGQSKQNINENINEKLLKINQLINFIGQLSEEEGTESVLPWYYWAEIHKFAIRFDRQSVLWQVCSQVCSPAAGVSTPNIPVFKRKVHQFPVQATRCV